MIKLKWKPVPAVSGNSLKPEQPHLTKEKSATELAVTPLTKPSGAGRSGVPPPAEHRFKPGAEWRGNRGGRPRILEEETAKYLEKKDKRGITNAQKHIEHLGKLAFTNSPVAIAAYNALKHTSIPAEQDPEDPRMGVCDHGLVRLVLTLMLERKEKQAKALEIGP